MTGYFAINQIENGKIRSASDAAFSVAISGPYWIKYEAKVNLARILAGAGVGKKNHNPRLHMPY